jgi:GNAT superfamily N-acetyltransferase
MEPLSPARPATPGDYPHFVRFFAELGIPDPVPDAARWEEEMLPGTLFLDGGGVPVAYALVRVLGEAGHVVNVVVDPAWRGKRVGGALMEAVAARLRSAGCVRWWLNVATNNEPAIRLYERSGLRRTYRSVAVSFPWDRVAALPREATPLTARIVDPAEDAALEAAFRPLAGRLAFTRTRPRYVIMRLVDPARPEDPRLGVAAFDPGFPGAYPFVVARPTLAAPLLEALRPHARPEDTFIRVTAEDDAALAGALVAAGASMTLEIDRMEGDLPAPP